MWLRNIRNNPKMLSQKLKQRIQLTSRTIAEIASEPYCSYLPGNLTFIAGLDLRSPTQRVYDMSLSRIIKAHQQDATPPVDQPPEASSASGSTSAAEQQPTATEGGGIMKKMFSLLKPSAAASTEQETSAAQSSIADQLASMALDAPPLQDSTVPSGLRLTPAELATMHSTSLVNVRPPSLLPQLEAVIFVAQAGMQGLRLLKHFAEYIRGNSGALQSPNPTAARVNQAAEGRRITALNQVRAPQQPLWMPLDHSKDPFKDHCADVC